MAVYKVIQDIEAEDKLLGPLTLKQFIFAAIAICFAFVGFMIASKTNIFVFIPFLIPTLAFGVLAAPFGRDQPTDVWLAAQIRFWIKPRKRIWDQSGIKNLVTITAPKKVERFTGDGLSQQEVKSRLKALAETIDSHGWAVKNADINLYGIPALVGGESDRLIDPTSLPQIVPEVDINAADDIMDANNNPIAQHFDEMVKESTAAQRQAAIDRMHNTALKNAAPLGYDSRHIPQAGQNQLEPDAVMFGAKIVTPGQENEAKNNFAVAQADMPKSNEELDLLEAIENRQEEAKKVQQMITPHHRIVKTPEEEAAEAAEARKAEILEAQTAKAQPVTPPKNPDIVNLANANDLHVSTIQSLANRNSQADNGEVVVNLR